MQNWGIETHDARVGVAKILAPQGNGAPVPGGDSDRVKALGKTSRATRIRLEHLLELALRGLPEMQNPDGHFAHTRRDHGEAGVLAEGDNLRYAAIVALGLGSVPRDRQRAVLGTDAATQALCTAERAVATSDMGAVALAAWAAAEVADIHDSTLFARLEAAINSRAPLDTVVCAWALCAALAARALADTRALEKAAADRLMREQGQSGLFPHVLPRHAAGSLRAHVGCFADQVYPIQALARYSAATGDPVSLARANACADRICALQGKRGQWWWHYDVRDGTCLEGYPVYSVHQHAMAPMALLDLWEAGGSAHWRNIISGLDWLDAHPEVGEALVSDRIGVVWRKVGRRDPAKLARKLAAASSALHTGGRPLGIDWMFPADRIDHECRPYEFGWMLYAWLSGGVVRALQPRPMPVAVPLEQSHG